MAKVYLQEGEKLDPAALRQAIKKADFTAGIIRIEAAGEVRIQRDKVLVLFLPSPEQKLVLQASGDEGKGKAVFEKLRQAVAGGASRFAISGIVRDQEKGGLILGVEAFEAPSPKEKR